MSKTKAETVTENLPNIKFIGKDGRKPVQSIRDGAAFIQMPKREVQKTPFYHEQASLIVRLFPNHYKIFRGK